MVKKTGTKQTRINLAVLDAVQSLLGKKEERKRAPQKEECVWPSSFVQIALILRVTGRARAGILVPSGSESPRSPIQEG
jgi:hypothetical protein